MAEQHDQDKWPAQTEQFESIFASKTRDEWCELLEGTNACFAPVLSLTEAPLHPHNKVRNTFVDVDGITQPAPAPRFSRTASAISRAPAAPNAGNRGVLKDWGLSNSEIDSVTAGE